MRKGQRQQRKQARLRHRPDFLFGGLEVAAVGRVEREILAVQGAIGQNLDHLPHLLDRLRHVPQLRQAERAVVARRRVGRVARDQVAVLLDAGLIVVGDRSKEAARAVAFALRHAVQMADGFLRVLLGILLPLQVARGRRHGAVRDAELRIEGDRLREALERVLELAARHRLHAARVFADRIERRRRQRLHREPLRRVGRVVAERLANIVGERGRHTQDLVLARGSVGRGGDHIARDRLDRLDRHGVPAALAARPNRRGRR